MTKQIVIVAWFALKSAAAAVRLAVSALVAGRRGQI